MKKLLNYASLLLFAIICSVNLINDVDAACDPDSKYSCFETKYRGSITATDYDFEEGISSENKKLNDANYNSSHKMYLNDFGLNIGVYKGNGDITNYDNYTLKNGSDRYWRHYDSKDGSVSGSNKTNNYSALYCLDSDLLGLNDLYATRFLMDPKTTNKGLYSFDIGVKSILVNSNSKGAYFNSSNVTAYNLEYIATSIAIRTMTATWGWAKSDGTDSNVFKAYYGQAHYWITTDSEIQSYFNVVSKYTTTLNSLAKYEDYIFIDVNYKNGNPVMNRAKELYKIALKEAANYIQKGTAKVEVKPETEVVTQLTEKEDSNGKYVYTDIKHTLSLKGFSNDGHASFIIKDVVYDNTASVVGALKEPTIVGLIINGQSINGANILNVNLLENAYLSDEVTIEIVVRFEGYTSSNKSRIPILKCGQQPMDYTINYTYNDSSLNKFSNYVVTVWYSKDAGLNHQRFLSIDEVEAENKDLEGEIKNSVSLTEACSCENLTQACKDSGSSSSDECQELFDAECGECNYLSVLCNFGETYKGQNACTLYSATCDLDCGTDVDSDFECCDEQNNLIVSTMDDKEININGPSDADIKACFVTQIDVQRESDDYSGAKDEEGNSYTLMANSYCTVSCKEDYAMSLPTAKLTNAGRYFTFKARVNGTKNCYTNTIDEEKYNEDIVAAQINMVNKYNEYLRWYELLYNGRVSTTSSRYCAAATCDEHGCGPTCSSYVGYDDDWYATASTTKYVQYTKNATLEKQGKISTKLVYKNLISDYLTCESPIYSDTVQCPGGEWTIPVNCTDEYGKVIYDDEGNATICDKPAFCPSRSFFIFDGVRVVNDHSDFMDHLEAKMNQAKVDLDKARKHYDDVIKEYAQCTDSTWSSRINYDAEMKYDYAEEYLDKFNLDGKMDESINSSFTDTQWFCNGDITANYEVCKSGAKYTRAATLKSIDYTVCTVDGCKPKTEQISEASYVKKTSLINVSYKPATLFYNVYPSGEISINKADDNIPLTNSLPVSLATQRGIYKYNLSITNLGEYYSRGTLGRLIGGSSAVIDKDKVEYVCSYLVNMGYIQTGDVVCDWNACSGKNCISNCIGPNCASSCTGEDCIADCIGVGCIYDEEAGTSLVEKTVSLNNLFPNGTNSYNWNKNANRKAEATINEIETAGNTVYEGTPILSITLDRNAAAAIRKYNDEAEDDGGYSNSTMSCYKLGGYDEMACYSSFIDAIVGDGKAEVNGRNLEIGNIVNSNSLIGNGDYRIKVNNSNTGYFKLWNGAISDTNMIGPAWK